MIRPLAAVFLALILCTTMSADAANPTEAFAAALDAQWDYDKPAISEERFRAELAKWPADSAQALEIDTQIARTLGLRRKFDEAHAVLDRVEAKLDRAPAHLRVRYLLERGRAFNSSGKPQQAVPLFAEALALADREHDEFYAVDAAHMLGIAAPQAERLDWDLKALALAEAANTERARNWRASLYHNLGWAKFESGDTKAALDYWQKAFAAREPMGNASRTRVAKWTVGRGYRAVGRLDDAEKVQRALAVELDAIHEPDGYVYEELAEIELARGNAKAAQPWAAKAHALLKEDGYLAANEAPRLARLADVAAGKPAPAARP